MKVNKARDGFILYLYITKKMYNEKTSYQLNVGRCFQAGRIADSGNQKRISKKRQGQFKCRQYKSRCPYWVWHHPQVRWSFIVLRCYYLGRWDFNCCVHFSTLEFLNVNKQTHVNSEKGPNKANKVKANILTLLLNKPLT